VPNLIYKDRLLVYFAFQDASKSFWIPSADISWTQDDCKHVHQITGPQSRFHTKQDAEAFILDTAKAWIDSQP
jgi:hypothetical protein